MLTYKELLERIDIARTKMGDVVKDFYKSDAPQFKGKSKEKRRQMAIAAKLEADRGVKEETDLEEGSYKDGETRMGSVGPITTDAERAERAKKYREKMMKKEEVEQIDEVNVNQIKKDLDSGMSHDAVIGKHANKRTTNTDAIRKVIKQHAWDKRMKKEEAEQIDELSTDTLRNYRNKARDDAFDAHDVDDDRRLRKRSYGANQAGKKILKRGEPLRKEEVEQTDEELKGNQHKIDANKNGKIDGHDFKVLRNAKKARYQ